MYNFRLIIIKEIYEYIFNTEGKKTRALICLLASKSIDIKPSFRVDLASIIELLHTATLVHDDVVDESELRRGARSVNQVWSNSYSVLIHVRLLVYDDMKRIQIFLDHLEHRHFFYPRLQKKECQFLQC